MADKKKGAPVDFAGPVFPNPHHITPHLDTDPLPEKMGVGKFKMAGAKGDVKKVTADPARSGVVTPEQMREPHISSFKHGTNYVPKTGLALIHKGEKVIPAKENKMGFSAADAMEKIAPKKAPKKEIHKIEHTISHNGKHIMTHKHHHPEHHADETHVMDNLSDVSNHLEAHAGTPNTGEAAPDAGGPAQLTAAPSPMPGA